MDIVSQIELAHLQNMLARKIRAGELDESTAIRIARRINHESFEAGREHERKYGAVES